MDAPIEGDFSQFYCCPERHLAGLSKACALIYPFALRISRKSGKFTCSVASVAEFFGISRRSVQRAYHELRELGFFILLESGKRSFEPSTFFVMMHKQWAKQNPGCCTEKLTYAWTEDGDPLGKSLWAASGGQVRFMKFQVDALRETGIPESEILSLFDRWYSQYKADKKGKRWRRSVPYRFLMELRVAIRSQKRRSAKGQ